MDRFLAAKQEKFVKEGGFREKLFKKRRDYKLSGLGATNVELLQELADSITAYWDSNTFDPKILTDDYTSTTGRQLLYNQLYEY